LPGGCQQDFSALQLVHKLCKECESGFFLNAHLALLVPNGWEIHTTLKLSDGVLKAKKEHSPKWLYS